MEGPGLEFTEAIIDNGKLGKHVVRFEAGLLAQQADGSAAVYLDGDTMLLSATTAAKTPRDSIDFFFPLTVDVEERMYAAGRIPGSFFSAVRDVRPRVPSSPAASLTARCVRPSLRDCVTRSRSSSLSWLSTRPFTTTSSPSMPPRCPPSLLVCPSPGRLVASGWLSSTTSGCASLPSISVRSRPSIWSSLVVC
ncbi:polyribonucleotide nucleotidyltransferase [Cutibacterium acnes JCM 18916]|nr:polyribonucleotide nucleotidyltransferase [Cutibacterium acnes JCM 18916]